MSTKEVTAQPSVGRVTVEIATGEFDENDIVRLEDDFGRHKSTHDFAAYKDKSKKRS